MDLTSLVDQEPRQRLEFRSESLGRPVHAEFETDVTIEIESFVSLDDGTHFQYWTVSERPPERIVEAVETLPSIREARLLSTVGDTHQFEVHSTDDSLISVFDSFDGMTKQARYHDGGLTVVAEFPMQTDTADVVEAVTERYPDMELVTSYVLNTVCLFRELVGSEMTGRQLTALRLAYYGGYYEQPRQSSGEELAARLGISKQAFHEHLRKAYATVFEALIEDGVELSGVDT